MKPATIHLALFSALSLAAAHAGSITQKLGMTDLPDAERKDRARLNEHIVAIGTDGRALEPYDFMHGFTVPIPAVGPHFPKAKTCLQRSVLVDWEKLDDPNKKTRDKARKDAEERLEPLRRAGFTCAEIDASLARFEKKVSATRKKAGAAASEPENMFAFADFVVPRMLEKARASGKPVVIFVHGGMNNLHEAIERGAGLIDQAEQDHPGCYPIFICWNSSFLSSWWEHWRFTRNGVDVRGDDQTWANLTLPIYAATDIATSIVRAPRTFLDNLRSTMKSNAIHGEMTSEMKFGDVQDARARYLALREANQKILGSGKLEPHERRMAEALQKAIGPKADGSDPQMQEYYDRLAKQWEWARKSQPKDEPKWQPMEVSMGRFEPKLADQFGRLVTYTAFLAPKVAIVGTLEGSGTGIWQSMTRRTEVMFHDRRSFRPNVGNEKFRPGARGYTELDKDLRESGSTGIGALSVFFRYLEDHPIKRVTAIGHSMGAMVLNRAVGEFPKVKFERLVYMAAACSVGDFRLTVLPYLDHQRQTHFYNLCLHPRSEDREQPLYGVAPNGSLLVWIDEFLNKPGSLNDRTLGQFENAMLTSRTIHPRYQARIHMTALSSGPGEDWLQQHGDFSSGRFWQPIFYEAKGWMPRSKAPSSKPKPVGRIEPVKKAGPRVSPK